MIIHNSTYSVAPESEDRWVEWIQEVHLPKIKLLPGMKSCRFLKLLTEVEQEGITYTIQAELADLASGEAFLRTHDPLLQNEMQELFAGQVLYFQTLLKVMQPED